MSYVNRTPISAYCECIIGRPLHPENRIPRTGNLSGYYTELGLR